MHSGNQGLHDGTLLLLITNHFFVLEAETHSYTRTRAPLKTADTTPRLAKPKICAIRHCQLQMYHSPRTTIQHSTVLKLTFKYLKVSRI
jgi:hypothetical protein